MAIGAERERLELKWRDRRNASNEQRTTHGKVRESVVSFPELVVAPIPLFLPRVTGVVIPILLPKTRRIGIAELDSAQPLRALPRIETRDDEPRG